MIRYYLIKAVRNSTPGRELASDGVKPDYLDIINSLPGFTGCKAIPPKEISAVGGDRQWLRNFYIIRVVADDFTALDATDAIHITRQKLINNKARLEAIGIDTTGLTPSTPRKEIERRLMQWLIAEDRDLSSVTNTAESID